MPLQAYKQTVEQVLADLSSSPAGLSSPEAQKRLDQYGPNKIHVQGESLWRKLSEPFRNVFMLILGIAAFASFLSGEAIDGAIILFIITIAAIIYYVQRFSADRVLRALEKHDSQVIATYRDGKLVDVPAEALVPGDVITLGEGQKVPADARILHAENTRADEAMLTGESAPVSKHNKALKSDHQIYERSNSIFQGSFIVSGTATAVVVATGNDTEFGQLAALSKRTELSSPMQDKINKLISQIVAAVSVLALLVFVLSLTRGINLSDSLRLVLTFSVSAVPEGLPIAISVILVLGMRRMARHQALVRSMSAIENVGIVTTIATDKTGTLTKNQLSVQDVWIHHRDADLQQTAGHVLLALNQNDGKLFDPLDGAFKAFADKYRASNKDGYTLVKTMPFEYQFAMSGNTWQRGDTFETYLKGAPERIIEICRLSDSAKQEALQKLHSLTGQGYRAIALARLTKQKNPVLDLKSAQKHTFEFLSLLAVADELRPEAKPSITAARRAGVTVRMITGDHFETAFAIAKQLGLAEHRNQVFDCTKMASMSDKELAQVVAETRVFSRVLPEYKHRILGILKEQGITAMTGDGVNDVPALTNAHIGVAMGSGTQIAKEAGDIVLLDNNFKSITAALREGRVIFDNIRRMLFYLLSTNLGEVLTTVMALLLGMPLPLLPVQILWTNLGTDTVMVIPLGLEPAEHDVMKRKPRDPKRPILGKVILSRMVLVGLTMMTVALSIFSHFLATESETYARTLAFSALVAMQLTNAFNARSEWQTFFKRMFVRNNAMFVGLAAALTLYTIAVFSPLSSALYLEQIALTHLAVTWAISIAAITTVNELHKLVGRQLFKKGQQLPQEKPSAIAR